MKLAETHTETDTDLERVQRMIQVDKKVAFGFEPSFMKIYRVYWLISERNVLNCPPFM